ncbi:MAG: hypothetical protein C0601_07180 [Candidatus Muiribacterium halophilum]|uniref:Outer membrane protein beta-barrel domain-containing protein n=1 Tax=Muiribacterium halophilum TaxID=2053465 RepID=A0A2N5ZFZ3_MUIH1|nr:MAG: hypothetical protein C0601_07180 [Candidatus Muirbacterium halophilum]
MNKKIIFLIFVLVFNTIFVFSLDQAKYLDYFYRRGYIINNSDLYENTKAFKDLEIATMLSEILQRVYSSREGTFSKEILFQCREMLNLYHDELLIVSKIDTQKIQGRLDILLSTDEFIGPSKKQRITAESYDKDNYVKAADLIKEKDSKEYDYFNVDSRFINKEPVRPRAFRRARGLYTYMPIDLTNKNYFSAAAGIYETKATSLSYSGEDSIYDFGIGYQRTSKTAFDFRGYIWESKGKGGFFDSTAVETYSYSIKPITASLKLNLPRFNRFIPYVCVGISRFLTIHEYNDKNTGKNKVEDETYCPVFTAGMEFHEKKDFFLYGEMTLFSAGIIEYNIDGSIYKVDPQNIIFSFGFRTYFR